MNVLVDTPIWSLALRRDPGRLARTEQHLVRQLGALIARDEAVLIGPVRHEILSGIRDRVAFTALAEHLAAYDDLSLDADDYVRAAEFFNACCSRGVSGSAVDLLICAAADRHSMPIFTTDSDFTRYSRVLPIRLFRP